MSARRIEASLRHMLDHAREATELVEGRTREDLEQRRLLNLALVRLLEIVGEGAGRIPPSEREQVPGIPWGEIIGLRNRLIHGYDAVDFDILWEILTRDLPELVRELERALARGTA